MARPHNNPEWSALAKRRVAMGKASSEPCCLCGGAIDYSLGGWQQAGPTAEHYQSVAEGGALIVPLEELGVAHRRCQSRQGGYVTARKFKKAPQGRPSLKTPPAIAHLEPTRLVKSTAAYSASPEAPPPRLFSDPHPRAVGTLGGLWADWLAESLGLRLRPWQRVVVDRALEVDEDNRLLWREIVVSTPRQSGKSYLIWALATARAQFAQFFNEPQECVHVANNLAAARRIHQLGWRWAAENDVAIYKSLGNEKLVWPDGSHWSLVATPAIWGNSASMAIVDEAWDIKADVVDSALFPTMVERDQPQIWLLSTANDECTSLMLSHRQKAIDGNAMIAEWSAPPGSDISDPGVWRAASPHWSPQRHDLIAESISMDGFQRQWLNMWPEARPEARLSDEWDALPEVGDAAWRDGVVGAVEASLDRMSYGTAVAKAMGAGRVEVLAATHKTEEDAMLWLKRASPVAVVAGQSLAARFGGPWVIRPATSRETAMATPFFAAAVRDGRISHNHDRSVHHHLQAAAVTVLETGPMLSARRSRGSIAAAKAVAWASAAAGEDWFGLNAVAAIW